MLNSRWSASLPFHKSQVDCQPYLEQWFHQKDGQSSLIYWLSPSLKTIPGKQLIFEKIIAMEKDHLKVGLSILNPSKWDSFTAVWNNPRKWGIKVHEVRQNS